MTMNALMRLLDGTRGAIRIEETFDTDLEDLWQACTEPERLARWLAQVSGEPVVGGTVQVTFTSTWSAPMRIEACEAPHHLLLTGDPGSDDETQLEAWLSEEGGKTRLVVEDRGIPADELHFHGAGWQAHLEDLQRSLAAGGSAHPEGWSDRASAPAWRARWSELTPEYEQAR